MSKPLHRFVVEADTEAEAYVNLLNHVCEYYKVDVKPVASLIGLMKNTKKSDVKDAA